METAEEKLGLIRQYFTEFTETQIRQLVALDALYRDWNSKINVISRKDEDGLYEKHVLHSLAIAAVFDFRPGMKVLDLGTGGGFPGIPLAILFPEVHFYLADSIGKKIKVVQAVCDSLALKNVTAKQVRAETISGIKFDAVVSRAVAPLAELLTWVRPVLRRRVAASVNSADPLALPVPYGLICLKGGDLAAEISASGTRPRMIEIFSLFQRDYFREKYLVYIPAGQITT